MIRDTFKIIYILFFLVICYAPLDGMHTALQPVIHHVISHSEEILDTIAGTLNLINNLPHHQENVRDNQNQHDNHSNTRERSDTFHNMQVINQLNEQSMHHVGLSFNNSSYLDSIADRILSEHAHDSSKAVLGSNGFEHVSQDTHSAGINVAFDATSRAVDALQDFVYSDNLQPSVTALNDSSSAERSCDQPNYGDRAFENRHAIELPTSVYHYEKNTNIQKVDSASRASQQLLELSQNNNILAKLEKVISRSNDTETIATQLAASIDELHIPREIMDINTKLGLREFFFDRNGHFHQIDSAERQEKCVNIIYPAIKACFENNRLGLIEYLKTKSDQGISGFRELLDYETGQAEAIDHVYYAVANVYSFFHTYAHKTPSLSEINHGPFVSQLTRIISLCTLGKIPEAKQYIEKLQLSIATNQNSQHLTKQEYDCLERIYNDLTKKIEISSQRASEIALAKAFQNKSGKNNEGTTLSSQTNTDLKKSNNGLNAIAKGFPNISLQKNTQNSSNENSITENINESGGGGINPDDPNERKEKNVNNDKQCKEYTQRLKTDNEYQECSQKLNEIKKEAPDLKINDHESGDLTFKQWEKLEKESFEQYERIRADKHDIEKVCKNLKIDKNFVERVKDHVFYNKHNLQKGIDNFDPNLNIADAWKRITDNKFVKTDIEWFLHEFAESKLEQSFPEASINEIHGYVNNLHNWAALLK